VPSQKSTFKPGDVYWLYGMRIAGWGPLAPGEDWAGVATPQQYLNANTTWASFPQDAQVIDPAGFTARPADPLTVSVFRAALPSPAFPASRLDAVRPQLRVGSTHFTPVLPGTTFQDANDVPPPTDPVPPPIMTAPPSADGPGAYPPDPGPPGPPMQTTYPVPAYTGIIVINPPDHPDYGRRNPNNLPAPKPTGQTSPPTSQPPAATTEPKPRVINQPHEPYGNTPRITPVITPRGEPRQPETKQAPAPTPPAASKTETPRAEAPRPTPPSAPRETPRVEAPRPSPPPPPAPRVETPKVEAPKVEAPKVDVKVDTPKKQ
jgi:hypothetical protein